MKILIAEDEVSIAKALKVMLEKNRYTVDMVYNGTDALDYGLQGAYDAMVLDVMMPGMNGLEVLRTLRSRGVSTPALFLTAKGEVEDRVEGLDAGADDYLPKPFASSEFLARVRALVRRSGNYQSKVLPICFNFFLRNPMYVHTTSISASDSRPHTFSIRCSEENTCPG